MTPTITLTTDFGLENEFVGVMKGVILSICPAARIVDISHNIRPQDIGHAASILKASCHYFPKQTIHVVVVDPGVGTDRSIIALKTDQHLFLAPDNGVLFPFLDEVRETYAITNKDLFLNKVSATFHGRDIFAPVAAHLAAGTPLPNIGPRIPETDLVKLTFSQATIDGDNLHGTVIDIDHFGNLVTNISQNEIRTFYADAQKEIITTINNKKIHGISDAYGDTKKGNPVALVGSRNLLEIAINQGNAADFFAAQINNSISLTRKKK